MIKSFADARTEAIYDGRRAKGFPPDLYAVAFRKLDMLRRAACIRDLRVPPGNRLEKLKGDRKDRYSIRVNDQWRIVFRWNRGDAEDVRIEDYH